MPEPFFFINKNKNVIDNLYSFRSPTLPKFEQIVFLNEIRLIYTVTTFFLRVDRTADPISPFLQQYCIKLMPFKIAFYFLLNGLTTIRYH